MVPQLMVTHANNGDIAGGLIIRGHEIVTLRTRTYRGQANTSEYDIFIFAAQQICRFF